MQDVFCTDEILKRAYYETKLSIAIYNKYPAVPGHSMIIPKRHVESFTELNEEECVDILKVSGKILPVLMRLYGTENSYDIVVQNGPYSGMSINHLHIHIIPRHKGDIYQVDTAEMYDAIAHGKSDRSIKVEKEIERLRKEFNYHPGSK